MIVFDMDFDIDSFYLLGTPKRTSCDGHIASKGIQTHFSHTLGGWDDGLSTFASMALLIHA